MDNKAAIIVGMLEDDKNELVLLENLLSKITDECCIDIRIAFACNSWESFIENVQAKFINVCFLDIDLNDHEKNGMNIAEIIDNMGKDIKIVFVTGYSSYMPNAFKVNAFDYLLKPLNMEDIKRTIARLKKKLENSKDCLEIYAQEYIRIPFKDIIYLKYEDRRVKIITIDSLEILPSTYTLKMIIQKLPQDKFIICSSWVCVNMHYLKRINGAEIELLLPGKDYEGTKAVHKIYVSQSGLRRVKGFINNILRT